MSTGDSDFCQLACPCLPAMHSAAFSILRCWDDTREVVQESLLKALRAREHFRHECKFSTWLVAITINEAKMRRRKDRRHLYVSLENPYGRTGDESSPLEVEDARPIASDLIEFGQLRRILICALNELQPEYRDVLRLRDITGANIRETAKILGITESNVKTRLLRARRKMREALCALRGGGQSETVSRPIRSRHLQIRDAQASGFDGTRRRGRSYKQFRPCLESDGF